jgi:hypothetical protein
MGFSVEQIATALQQVACAVPFGQCRVAIFGQALYALERLARQAMLPQGVPRAVVIERPALSLTRRSEVYPRPASGCSRKRSSRSKRVPRPMATVEKRALTADAQLTGSVA